MIVDRFRECGSLDVFLVECDRRWYIVEIVEASPETIHELEIVASFTALHRIVSAREGGIPAGFPTLEWARRRFDQQRG